MHKEISFLRILEDADINRATLCASVPQGVNHFCVPSDLLNTTICFSQLIAQ
jgi:hypothetical protein